MKKLFIFSVIILLSNCISAQESIETLALEEIVPVNWESSFKKALKKSKREKKPILIYFTGSDWCSPCKILDKKLFHSEKFKAIADKDLILYEANNPRNKDLVSPKMLEENYKLISKYKVKSYPTLVFINHQEKMIGYKKGLILTEYYYPFIQSVIENY
ncbi:thioredoxin family protein [Polaribacter sp. PL03]|uniref:thioredoxin family protein n=1 Tax=Polaribacter sp. PL03 TaxID=3088353 RepID=UPI0029D33FAB|nr:thioredoxin family protein [Polaribacter sp. PL03]MDX6747748.1 thioredoxin family protein [Polaribacter sp. PL03]